MHKPKFNPNWPVLKTYDEAHQFRIAMPLGGIGTGTVSLGGRGDLRDWELTNRPGKGFRPFTHYFVTYPLFLLRAQTTDGKAVTRLLEGPIDPAEYESASGCTAANHGYPRFAHSTFAAAYPLAQVALADESIPLQVRLESFNPLVPCDADASGIPVAVMRYVLTNPTGKPIKASLCGVMINYIGLDKSGGATKGNRNRFRKSKAVRGIFMDSQGIDPADERWGTMALTTTAGGDLSYWLSESDPLKGNYVLKFWEDFKNDGRLDNPEPGNVEGPMGALAVPLTVPAKSTREVTFLITWHYPNRQTWTPCKEGACSCGNTIGNYYTEQYKDAWDAAEKTARALPALERDTVQFVRTFCDSDLPATVKEAALFNLSTLRSQTTFRTPDGRLYGFEGCSDACGCCHGSCTHVWNYELATPLLFGGLAATMRDVEFAHATNADGLMSFRVNLPLQRATETAWGAADGQMGCIMKMYRDWQLSGDDAMLNRLWPKVKKALEFCWLPGGWDADKDGVMEGSQHNTMDCEYFGPNPQMGLWYLGALRAGEEMARRVGDEAFAATCGDLFTRGSRWIDANLFNGEYYIHEIRVPKKPEDVRAGTGGFPGVKKPDELTRQLGEGCLVDQLVGQFMAHVCGLGYLVKPAHIRKTLASILKYNRRDSFRDHFNCMRGYVVGDEAAMLMAAYPYSRPTQPFPYFTEVMTGFEYVAAINMIQEGMTAKGLQCIQDIRDRYDGRKRSPFDEAECGHHYARAMASWAAVPALTGFLYSAITGKMTFAAKAGQHFWSTGYAWGRCAISRKRGAMTVELKVLGGKLKLKALELMGLGEVSFKTLRDLRAGKTIKANYGVRQP
ncbi:MAG: GH116 family glycosyl-hydrolase [Planctomycetaceae bacterium]|nr:non-lysosomal glucosylceramidase [Planctomycetaceae bacterium]